MKALRRVGIVALAVAGVLGLALGCGNPLTNAPQVNPRAAETVRGQEAPDSAYEPQVIGGPGSPLSVALLAGRTHEVGTVEAWLEEGALYVRYTTAWSLAETHLEVVADPVEFPQTRGGNPIPGRFAYKMSHDRGTDTYTYCVDMAALEAAETLYFAAHAEVEKWVGGVCVDQESAWAEGLDFPGANWATYFAGVIPTPIDLTGYWDMYLTMEGMPELGPGFFYIQQTGSELRCSHGMSGEIHGDQVTLGVWFEGECMSMTGTLSGDVISLDFSGGPFGSGSIRLERSDFVFGHLDMAGSCQGVEISLDTGYAYAQKFGPDYWYTHSFSVDLNGTPGTIMLRGRGLSAGQSYEVTEEGEESEILQVELWDWTGTWQASSGTVTIHASSPAGMQGSFSGLSFPHVPGHSELDGSFDLVFDSDSGTVVLDGTWLGAPISTTMDTAWSSVDVWAAIGLNLFHADHRLDTVAWFGFEGESLPEAPFDLQGWVWFRWLITGEEDNSVDLAGESAHLWITALNDQGMAGSFTLNFEGGGTVTGNFDVPFAEGYGLEPPSP